MPINNQIKIEKTHEEVSNDGSMRRIEDINMSESETRPESSENQNDADLVVKEIDIYFSKSLANKIFVLQFPIRPNVREYDDNKVQNARIKPKQSRVELELELNTTSDNYSRVKGEQFAINVDVDQTQKGRYFQSNIMDKVVLTSSNACLGQMNRLYQIGLIQGDETRSLHLTPIHGIVQMKPSFEYFDLAEKRLKELSGSSGSHHHQDDNSTEDEPDSEVESKPELVTLKYGMTGSYATTQSTSSGEEQNWINARYNRINSAASKSLSEHMLCKQQDVRVKIDLKNEELIKKSVDYNSSITNVVDKPNMDKASIDKP